MNTVFDNDRHISLLSKLVFHGYDADFSTTRPDVAETLSQVDLPRSEPNFSELVELGDKHHVTVRALRVLEKIAQARQKLDVQEWCATALHSESSRILRAVEWLHAIVQSLQASGCPVSVIKSLDHWPDLGSDLDLYTSGEPEQVARVMRDKLQAQQ